MTDLVQQLIIKECNALANFLIEKNKAYGNSALVPCNIFSKASAEEQMNVRIDDKLNRIMCGHEYPGDDTEKDIIGYLILKRVEREWRQYASGADYYESKEPDGDCRSTGRVSGISNRGSDRDQLLEDERKGIIVSQKECGLLPKYLRERYTKVDERNRKRKSSS